MRWGVRDEATDDHVTAGLCLQEIDNCQRLSVGPNFCVSEFSVFHRNIITVCLSAGVGLPSIVINCVN